MVIFGTGGGGGEDFQRALHHQERGAVGQDSTLVGGDADGTRFHITMIVLAVNTNLWIGLFS